MRDPIEDSFPRYAQAEACALLCALSSSASRLSVLFGLLPELGLACIALFLACATPLMHNFWDLGDPAHRLNEMGNFMKNMALFGASLMMLAVPRPWPYSLEARRRAVRIRG